MISYQWANRKKLILYTLLSPLTLNYYTCFVLFVVTETLDIYAICVRRNGKLEIQNSLNCGAAVAKIISDCVFDVLHIISLPLLFTPSPHHKETQAHYTTNNLIHSLLPLPTKKQIIHPIFTSNSSTYSDSSDS